MTELFSSLQGEGPHVGARQIFVRFYGCHRRCDFCDSPETVTAWQPAGFRPPVFRVEWPAGSNRFEQLANPISPADLAALVLRFDVPRGLHHSVAITGGEPLLHAPFLKVFLPLLRAAGLRIYLETSGDLFLELDRVLDVVDIVAMDIKLPSVTKNEPSWGHHRRFLERCVSAGVEVFAKAIVSGETSDEDIRMAAQLVKDVAPGTLLLLQPMTPFGRAVLAPTPGQLLHWQATAQALTDCVRVIPQCHKMMGSL